MSYGDEVPMDISMEEDDMVLNEDVKCEKKEKNVDNVIGNGKRSTFETEAGNLSQPAAVSESVLTPNSPTPIPISFNKSIWSEMDAIATQAEIDVLIQPSPKKEPIQIPNRRPPIQNTLSGKIVKVIVPIEITDDSAKVEVDPDTNTRSYFNDYYSTSLQLTKTEGLMRKLSHNGSAEDKTLTEIVKYTLPTTDQVISLYRSLDLYDGKLVIPTLSNVSPKFRPSSVLIRGVNGMNTTNVFKYLRTYHHFPVKLEWVNDVQCVVVFSNVYEAARCLIDLGKEIILATNIEPPTSRQDFELQFDQMTKVPKNWVEIPMPNSHVWRFTVADSTYDTKRKPGFLLTIAKRSDKKQEYAEAFSDYYRAHGNPNSRAEVCGIWTKSGYEQRMQTKAEKLMSRRLSSPPPTATTSTLNENRIPVLCRLGSPLQNFTFDSDEKKNGEERKFVGKLSRRSVTIQRRTHFDEESGLERRWNRQSRLNNEIEFGQFKGDSEYSDSGRVDRRGRNRSNWNHDNQHSSSFAPSSLSRGTIHDRLGW